ncbi:hypothetical protein [Streptomyces sp. VNUA24]|uniref:hypothetical protein n=1 Tax=Streptomyces sp. VNUA24 TaxID=3031131 RepID=UPI0023B82D2B|nr:hypothetical protein [Streptomyces sp. VNUA24]WEH16559.1 hypothetical protein PYR72_23740 [Streptomyces sp. VNUA24]
MTDDYASTMVTVIPVILVVATVEFQALWNREPRPPAGEGATGRVAWDTVLLVMWNGLIVSHAVVEVKLIMWLATTERPESPELAWAVAFVAWLGLACVAVLTALLTLGAVLRVHVAMFKDLVRDRKRHPRTGSRPTPGPPQRRMRPSNPAHRSVRGPRRVSRTRRDATPPL